MDFKKQKMKLGSYCIFLLVISHHLFAFSGKYPIRNFTSSDYKAGIQNIDFAQNRDMKLFVANNLGVLSFNGNDWDVHGLKSGKKERSLGFDEATNRLYVGSQGTFGYYNEEWVYVSLLNMIPQDLRNFDEVWDVFLMGSKVYFCTFQGIYIYDGQSISVLVLEEGFDRSFQVNGKIFTQNQKGELFEIRNQELIPALPQNLKNQIISGIIPQDKGYLLFYNSGEIEYTSPLGAVRQYDNLINVLQGTYVNHVLQLSDTRLAISTQTKGLFLYDLQKQSIENITIQDDLLSNACLRTFQDYSGNLWVGMQNGISLLDVNSPMRFINQDINIEGSGYEAFEVEEGTYYTTSNGIYFLSKNATKSIFLNGTEGPAYGMQRIAGKLYAGHHSGLFLLEKGSARRIAFTDGLWNVKQLQSQPEFAIGGTYSGLFVFKLNESLELRPLQNVGGFDESSRFFEEDQEGAIWVGQFYKGLYKLSLSDDLTEASVKKISEKEGLPHNDQIVLSQINNELYLATKTGIYKIDQATDRITKAKDFAEEIGEQQVYLLVQDNQKNIHVLGEDRVGFFKQISSNNYAFIPSSLFQLRYSFNNDLLNVSTYTSNGILFNANEGFIHYRPELESRMIIEKPLIISKIYSVTEDSVLFSHQPFVKKPENYKKLRISPNARILQFDVELFQYNDANQQQYRYLLKGFDEEYGDWTNMTTKEYTNLKEGDYQFLVQTKDYLGEIITSEPFNLRVQPPFYRSLPAKIFYGILGLLTLFMVSRFQKGVYKHKAKKVEKASQLRLAEKQEELIQIERLREQELTNLKEEKMQSELRHLNNLLAASTMNLVVKNEFIENIKEKLQEVSQRGKNKETKQELERIVKEINITLRLQEDWEQFEHHFDQVHGDFLTRMRDEFLELSPNEQKLCAFLRLNLNTKDIANLMGISLRGVEVARYRLRKKLGLNKGQNLSKFILEY